MSDLLPAVDEWPADGKSPVRVLCAALAGWHPAAGWVTPRVWMNEAAAETGAAMNTADLCDMISTLARLHEAGVQFITWGGTSGDWRVLWNECRAAGRVVEACTVLSLAKTSVDVPLVVSATTGCWPSLRSACAALGLDAKDAGASAAVPTTWRAPGGVTAVRNHVLADAVATVNVYRSILTTGKLEWVNQRGSKSQWETRGRWKHGLPPLEEALALAARDPPKPKFDVPRYLQPAVVAAWIGRVETLLSNSTMSGGPNHSRFRVTSTEFCPTEK